MTTTCKYCDIIAEEHNRTQEKACHTQYREMLLTNATNGKMTAKEIINNRWKFNRI